MGSCIKESREAVFRGISWLVSFWSWLSESKLRIETKTRDARASKVATLAVCKSVIIVRVRVSGTSASNSNINSRNDNNHCLISKQSMVRHIVACFGINLTTILWMSSCLSSWLVLVADKWLASPDWIWIVDFRFPILDPRSSNLESRNWYPKSKVADAKFAVQIWIHFWRAHLSWLPVYWPLLRLVRQDSWLYYSQSFSWRPMI